MSVGDPAHDPLSLLQSIIASLARSLPRAGTYPPERWRSLRDTANEVREKYSEVAPDLFSILRQWLRVGLDDASFADARRELDEVESRARVLASAGTPRATHGCTM